MSGLPSNATRILFVASSDNQVRMFASVIAALDDGVPVRTMVVSQDAYHDHNAEGAIRQLGLSLIAARRSRGRKSYRECSTVERLRFLREGKAAVDEILTQQRPAIVVVGNDVPYVSNQFVRQAQGSGTPTLLIQDGFFAPSKPDCGIPRRRSLAARLRSAVFQSILRSTLGLKPTGRNGLNGCDRIAVSGAFTRDLLTRLGAPADRITVTGLPQFDALARSEPVPENYRHDFLTERGIDPTKPHVVFFSQPLMSYDRWPRDRWERLLDLVASLNRRFGTELSVSIKPHPRDKVEDFDSILKRNESGRPPVRFLREVGPKEVLEATDVAVVFYSTVALEALHLDIPIVRLNPWNQEDPFGFIARKAAVEVSCEADWDHMHQVYIQNGGHTETFRQGRAQALADHVYKQDGRAAQRIADLILEMTARGGDRRIVRGTTPCRAA